MKIYDKAKKIGKRAQTIVPPPNRGWCEHTLYIVGVAWNANNPVHKAILHTGFINKDGSFGGYCEVWQNSYETSYHANDAYYLEFIQEIGTLK